MDEYKLLINKKILIALTIIGTILPIVSLFLYVTESISENDSLFFIAPITVFFHAISWLIVLIDLSRMPIRNKKLWYFGLFSPGFSLTVILYLINREKYLRLYKKRKQYEVNLNQTLKNNP